MKKRNFSKSARTKTETRGGGRRPIVLWPSADRPMAHRPMAHRQTHSGSQKFQKNKIKTFFPYGLPWSQGGFCGVRKHIHALFHRQNVNKTKHVSVFLILKTKNAYKIDQIWSKLRFDPLKISGV